MNLTEEDIDFLLNSEDGKISQEETNMFGTKIQYYEAKSCWPDTEKLHDMSKQIKNDHLENFTMTHENNANQIKKIEVKNIFNLYIRLITCILKFTYFSLINQFLQRE